MSCHEPRVEVETKRIEGISYVHRTDKEMSEGGVLEMTVLLQVLGLQQMCTLSKYSKSQTLQSVKFACRGSKVHLLISRSVRWGKAEWIKSA